MNKKTILLTAAIQILLTGCAAYYPQTVDVPLIQGKGDMRIDAGIFLLPKIDNTEDEDDESGLVMLSGVHGTFTAGLTDHFAVQTYLSTDMFRVYIQGALGLYNRFENNAVIEMYSGFGYGSGAWVSEDSGDTTPNHYSLVFTQLNWGRSNLGKRHIDYGLGLKGGYIFANSSASTDGWLVEPTVFFRFGSNKVKFNTKINYMWTNTLVENKNLYFPVSVSFGVNFHAGKRFHK
ncbi:MAG: hypothetical protein LBE91_17235 [Tannerella sp.]|jgi:hypothetical protein|nr:hypothetical protein [Tannerella sp.]